MAAHSFLRIGGQLLFACREGYITEFAAVFRDDELVTDLQAPVYALTAKKLCERLDVLGFNRQDARNTLRRAYSKAIEYEPELAPLGVWLDKAATLWNTEGHLEDVPGWAAWSVDPRLVLRLLLHKVDDDAEVALDIGEVVSRGYVEARSNLCADAFGALHEQAAFSPLIVLTEGRSDAVALGLAIDVLAPHLAGYIRFLDHQFKPEGGAAAVVRALKAFAAAGVSNRVLALVDNDAAARDALRPLKSSILPSHFHVALLPHLPLAAQYPTLGPAGLSEMDVNGLAVSLEMFFGEDVLRRGGTELTPVQWRGYVAGVDHYQGEVMHKAELQAAFRERARKALEHKRTVPPGDWSGMKLVIDKITKTFS